MKKFIPFLISGILAIGTFGCGEQAAQTDTESSDATTTEATQPSVQEASDKTAESATDPAAADSAADPAAADSAADPAAADSAADPVAADSAADPAAADSAADPAAADGDITTAANKALKEKLPTSKLEAKEEEGVVTVSGTVSSEAELNEIEPAVKNVEGVKEVKVDAKVEEAAPAQ